MSNHHPTPDERRRHLRQILDHFDTAMLVSRDAEDAMLVARPMKIAGIDDDGTMYFVANAQTHGTRDIEVDPRVAVTVQNKTAWATLTGTCHVSGDRDLIDLLWQEEWRIFHPGGPDDPALCVLVFEPDRAEYWDGAGTRGLSFLVRAAKAYVTGNPVVEPPEHAEIQLGR
ncbi:MAG TPA: pyridoxamine 5'-phosphate oxidase family protein [Kofleriaceae bacterium]|nr:pyridoxamine 5'-phosphate oxidase family protein [Kofleriaceae bacterium]